MAILPGFQALIDQLTPLPAKVAADQAAAVAAAEAAHTQDVADTLNALTPVIAAVAGAA